MQKKIMHFVTYVIEFEYTTLAVLNYWLNHDI